MPGPAPPPAPAAPAKPVYNPLQPSYLGAPPQGQASYMGAPPQGVAATGSASTLSPAQLAALGPQQTLAQIMAGFQPQARQSTAALNDTLAASGIVGGGAQGAQQLLQGQLASSLAPTLANAIQTSQGNVLGAEETNMGALNTQTLANQAARNQMTGTNLQDWMTQGLANQQASNTMTGMNVEDWMRTNMANQGAANQSGSQLAQMLMQGWQAPLQAYSGLQGQGLSTAGGLAQQEAQNFPVYQQQPSFFSQLMGGAAAAAPFFA